MNEGRSLGPRRATLASEVRDEIERMIIDGELAADEKLNELALSTVMGVSRGTVREAIRSLADSGLIDLIANRGSFVHKTTFDEVRNIHELRGAIFSMACASAARRVSAGVEPKLVTALEHNLEQMRETLADSDIARHHTLNIEFHDLLLQGAGNPKAKMVYNNLHKEMHLFRRKGLLLATDIARSIAEHEAIVRAVAAGDAEGARCASLDHITGDLDRYTPQ